MLNPLVPKFRPDLSVCLKDIAEKQVLAKLKPIVVATALQDRPWQDLKVAKYQVCV